MGTVGMRKLNQNASAIVARAVEGEIMTITDRGRPVAVLTGITSSPLEQMIEQGMVELPKHGLSSLPPTEPGTWEDGLTGQQVLDQLRGERLP